MAKVKAAVEWSVEWTNAGIDGGGGGVEGGEGYKGSIQATTALTRPVLFTLRTNYVTTSRPTDNNNLLITT